MEKQDEQATALPGILPTVASGFDVVTAHLWLVLFPTLLDVFYWIGPQLRSRSLLMEMAALFRDVGAVADMSAMLTEVAGRTNLFTVFSVPYLGIPGLMAGLIMPEDVPLVPPAWEILEPGTWLLWFLGLSLGGLVVATVYHGLIARAVCSVDLLRCPLTGTHEEAGRQGSGQDGRRSELVRDKLWRSFPGRLPIYWRRILGLAVALVLLMLAVYIPLALLATVVALLSPGMASLVMFLGLAVVLWLIFYLSFSLHGILLRERPVLQALLESMRLVRRNWTAALMLFILILLVRNILAWLWLSADTGSWITLVGIVGYAFVNTSLIAATFIFYRDRIEHVSRRAPRGQLSGSP
jgi:hypothetical protein